jgi:hypothetical protein
MTLRHIIMAKSEHHARMNKVKVGWFVCIPEVKQCVKLNYLTS